MKNLKFMTKTYSTLAAALLLAGALTTTACSNEDMAAGDTTTQPAEGRTVLFTATLAPHGDNGSTTRTITVNNQGTANETLEVKWKENEEIAVYYLKSDGTTHATAKAKVTAVDNETGVATIETVDGYHLESPKDNSEVLFVYPYSLHNGSGGIDESMLQNNQNGLLNTGTTNISKNYDAATGRGTLNVSAGSAVTTDRISLKNECCICKIQLSFSTDGTSVISNLSAGKTLTISVSDGRSYTISSPFQEEGGAATVGGDPVYRAFKSGDVIYVAMLPVSSKNVTFMSVSNDNKIYRYVTTGVNLAAGTFYRNIPLTLTLTSVANRTLAANDAEVTLRNGDVLTGTGGANTQLKIAAGATVTLYNVTNTGITQQASIAGIECLGDATIILEGTNSVTGRWNAPGILVPKGFTLTIKGTGKLTATGGSSGAGIGGTEDTSCGSIVIEGGNITATGTEECAGIGSGLAYSSNITCGDITISGGTVKATGGTSGAGIGSGYANQASNTCGAITISGGTVKATGGAYAAGIGSGHAENASNTCGAITISGGTVTATGGKYAAGIGSGNGNNYTPDDINFTLYVSACGAISITGGTVDATGGNRAAGIGSGEVGKFASISIGSGITSVTATRSNNYINSNVPIGKGNNDQGSGAVTIDGQTLTDAQTQGTTNTTFGSINVAVSPYGSNNGLTWTLTPKN